jgi:dTDP-4-dehydrorhamnose reductase
VYAASGNNFLLTMLRLAREGKALRVVDDQLGAPTSNLMIAKALADGLRKPLELPTGVFHMTARGEVSWHGFAAAIFEELGMRAALTPISSGEYPTPARRPVNSRLDNAKLERLLGIRLPDWRAGLREILAKITTQ